MITDITIIHEEFNCKAINVPGYYRNFMQNLGGNQTEEEDVWIFDYDFLPELEKFLNTCNVKSGVAGFAKRQWTEEVKQKRKLNKILLLAHQLAHAVEDDLRECETLPSDKKLDIIINLLECRLKELK